MNRCHTHFKDIARYINNVGDNWRNGIYISCTVCRYEKEEYCDDILVSFDENGQPTFIPVKDANCIFGSIMDKSEFLCEISNVKFEMLFQKFLHDNSDDKTSVCPFVKSINREKFPKKREIVGK